MSTPGHAGSAGSGPAGPGSLATEAALLVGVLRDWIASSLVTPCGPQPAGGPRDVGASTASEPDAAGPDAAGPDAPGVGSPGTSDHPWPCSMCPLCGLLSGLAGDHPEVIGHVMTALGALAAAVRTVRGGEPHAHPDRADHPASRGPWPGGTTDTHPPTAPRPRVQRIDIL